MSEAPFFIRPVHQPHRDRSPLRVRRLDAPKHLQAGENIQAPGEPFRPLRWSLCCPATKTFRDGYTLSSTWPTWPRPVGVGYAVADDMNRDLMHGPDGHVLSVVPWEDANGYRKT